MKIIPLTFLTLALSLATLAAQDGQKPQITVSGTSEVLVAPDEAIIHVAVEIRNESLEQAQRLHNDRVKSALTFLKSSGVPDKYVQTDFINLTTEANGEWSKRTVYYVARTSIEVKLTNVTTLEKTLSGLLTAGVDRIDYVEFRTSQLRKYRDQARALAIQAAKEKADALCSELDVKRGKPLNINANESGGWYNRFAGYWGGRGMASNSQVSVQETGGTSDSTSDTLSLGQISVSATVNVSFALQD